MKDAEFVIFLQEVLPRLRLRWEGFRKVRGQVRKRIKRRLEELGIADLAAYREYLTSHPAEWENLYNLCRITISRFYRDRGVFDALRRAILPGIARSALGRGEREVRAWSAGCAGGEEAYTLRIVWDLCVRPAISDAPVLTITATDADTDLLERARAGIYQASSLKELPDDLKKNAFDEMEPGYMLREEFKHNIDFIKQDIRTGTPNEIFTIILCRNLIFTYFDQALKSDILERIAGGLTPDGYLVIGAHEALPECDARKLLVRDAPCIFIKRSNALGD